MLSDSRHRILLSLMVLFSLMLVSATGLFLTQQSQGRGNTAVNRSQRPTGPQSTAMVSQGRFNEALKSVDRILEESRAKADAKNWTKALVRGVQLRMGLHGYETAVRFLREQKWPEEPINHAVLQLYYAQALQTYYSGYSWEINRREPVGNDLPADLKAWTRDQIFGEARRTHEELWQQRAELGDEPITRLSEYIQPNDYPAGIRETLRDALSYFYVALLSNTAFWKPQEENDVYQLNLQDLSADPVSGQRSAGSGSASSQPSAAGSFPHPLLRTIEVIKDLEQWHATAGRREAALEARLERLRRLHAAFTQEEDRKQIKAVLERTLPGYRNLPWWAMGQAELAEMVREEAVPGKLVRAREIAQAGYQAYPGSIGGKRCLHIVKTIEQPSFGLAAMLTDAAQKRSIEVSHSNITKIYFRAHRVDLLSRLTSARDYNLLLNGDEHWKLSQSAKPDAEWAVDLPATPDFETHRTFVTPPLSRTGYYVILASANKGFTKQLNQLSSVNFILTDLVLLVRQRYSASDFEIQVLSGKTGQPITGAEVDLYQHNWQAGHRRVSTVTTGPNGIAHFRVTRSTDQYSYSYFVVARYAGDVALDANAVNLYGYERSIPTSHSLVYTDRSVYRPNQKLFWKILAFNQADQQRFAVATGTQVNVSLMDANNQELESQTVTTNEFGTACGEFVIPSGRMLGRWYLRTSFGNATGLSGWRNTSGRHLKPH